MKENDPQALSAGRAAACWQENITRQTARLQRLQQLCSWVMPLLERRPKLRDRPIWGECLAQLTHPVDKLEDSKFKPVHPRHGQVKRMDRPAQLERTKDPVGGTVTSTHKEHGHSRKQRQSERKIPAKISQPHELNRKVSRNLLERMADQVRREPGDIAPAQESRGRVDRFLESSLPLTQHNALSQQSWLDGMARRAGQVFHPAGRDAAQVLKTQWSTGLNGEAAPLALLHRWPVVPSIHGAPSSGGMKNKPEQPRSFGQMAEKAELAQLSVAGLNQPPVADADSAIYTSAPASLPVAGWRDDVEGEWASSYRIAPPAVASSLPRLLPPQGNSESTPAWAAIISRQHARHETAASEDDLAGLAENIKRILDEEARRHGIDV